MNLPPPTAEQLLQHDGWLRALSRCLVSDDDVADDCVQQTWLAVVEHPPDEIQASASWLSRVLGNAVYRSHRTRGRRRSRERVVARHESVEASPLAELERSEVRRRVATEVGALREPHRTVILLRYYEEVAPAEIATRLNLLVETVYTQLRRGIAELRRRSVDTLSVTPVLNTLHLGGAALSSTLIGAACVGVVAACVGFGVGRSTRTEPQTVPSVSTERHQQ